MYDIIVNGQLVATCIDGVAKAFATILIEKLPIEMALVIKKHAEPQTETKEAKEKK